MFPPILDVGLKIVADDQRLDFKAQVPTASWVLFDLVDGALAGLRVDDALGLAFGQVPFELGHADRVLGPTAAHDPRQRVLGPESEPDDFRIDLDEISTANPVMKVSPDGETQHGDRDGTGTYLDARDRALRAVVTAGTIEKAQAAWRLAKAHNRCAIENYRGEHLGLEFQTPPAGHTSDRQARGGVWTCEGG